MIETWKLLAGLGIFLLAMQLMENALKNLAGEKLTGFIHRNTNTPLKGVFTGTIATAILQSSSLVTLMLMAFVGAGLLSVQNSLGVIYGCNLGTTLTGWIVTLLGFNADIGIFAYPMTAIGALLYTVTYQKPKWSPLFQFITSFGLLFIGLEYMKLGMSGLTQDLNTEILKDLSVFSYFVFGFVLTALIQSSSATMLITLTALNTGIIQLYDAGAIVIGADLGTTVTALIGSIGGSRARLQTALAHFIFNLTTDSIAFALLTPLIGLSVYLIGNDQPLLNLVLFHSLFNFIGILVFLPLTKHLATFLERIQSPSPKTIS